MFDEVDYQIGDPFEAAERLEQADNLSPRQRAAREKAINDKFAEYKETGLKVAADNETYVKDTTDRLTATYTEVTGAYDGFADWLLNTEPTEQDARRRLDSLHRQELTANRLQKGIGDVSERTAAIKRDPARYALELRKRYTNLGY